MIVKAEYNMLELNKNNVSGTRYQALRVHLYYDIYGCLSTVNK